MKFYQRAIDGSNTFVECEQKKAEYCQNAAGNIVPVGELLNSNVNNNFVNNVPIDSDTEFDNTTLPEPLPMPTMNFDDPDETDEEIETDDDEITDNNNGLPMPKMKFDKPKTNKQKKVNQDVLPLPSMKF